MPDGVDPAFAALLSDPRAALRRLAAHVPLRALRAGANAFMASAPQTPVHAVEDITASGPDGTIPLRLYRPSAAEDLPVILFMHGGGFILGSLDTHDAMCRSLCSQTGAAVLAIDYRLSPEAPYPAALDDIAAVQAMIVRGGAGPALDSTRIAIVGDSAGGHLAATAALTLPVRHVGLIYPMIDPAHATASADAFAEGYMLTGSFVAWAWQAYAGPASGALTGVDLSRYPPTTILTAEYDPLRDEGEVFGARLRAAGCDVAVERFGGMIHGFVGLPQLTARADEAIGAIARRIRASFAS
ncbi:alpha/beta hydrolase [Sphingomonas floccifaciens]|uniref:Alpha/beta hydrolase n=1 Tax=Sphingomonas floccifaciens TaxID=1844115 RepID=A0ABW4NHS0_9SPHN